MESIVSSLPLQKSSRSSSTATRFLIGLLRTANILSASRSCREALEKKIGTQLEQATLDDLLIPSYSYLKETLYDVERILSYFFEGLDIAADRTNESAPGLMLVGKLIDGYLAEIASDANLKPDRFYKLAVSSISRRIHGYQRRRGRRSVAEHQANRSNRRRRHRVSDAESTPP
ncbi:BTB/POZ domain-containing protein At5g66560 [Linum perenne]